MAWASVILSVGSIILALISIRIAVRSDKQAKKTLEKIKEQTRSGEYFA